ncbi:U6 small nuclear RNA (adenine-(43)-N(6))-methyltransferase [Ostrinia nubilalis]|uniref:U6 small nuclear RNA (adenine-(43)-N(6))-methyltransferase n=1 Tax=Ostrinia nubilalis TaxID=29057 RepID=UPI0030822114
MALNNYMHPRNIYKTPPDFADLAKRFPAFSSISKMDITGKVTIDFKDPHSLRILTKCLLKSDFGLDIEIPEDRLVPTLPLRLNYILWIEDLLLAIGKKENVWGIDIGTGACAIYPVLAATKNKWNMIGTETDAESFKKAQENIDKNNLSNFIKLSKNTTSSVVQYLLDIETDQRFDFCMCNPPFYSSIQELCESRNPSRQPPKNGFTGSPQELVTEGGELEFCRKLIEESKIYKDRILFFTTMIGHKYNLKELLHDLTSEGIKYTHTEFCQGRVTRWGLAWTYQEYDIEKLVPSKDKIRKKSKPIAYQLTELPSRPYDVDTCTEKIMEILTGLQIKHKLLSKRGKSVCMQMTAFNNTWSHQRRKRRLQKQQEQESKKMRLCSSNEASHSEPTETQKENANSDDKVNENNNKQSKSLLLLCENGKDTSIQEPILQAFLKIFKKENAVLFEMEYISGNAGKEGIHQIVQYIKNNWK